MIHLFQLLVPTALMSSILIGMIPALAWVITHPSHWRFQL